MSGDAQLMLVIAGLHLLGLACAAVLILPALRDGPDQFGPDGPDDGWGRGPGLPPSPPPPPRGGIPLPDAEQSRLRLRDDHGRLFDQLPRRERRPAREPERTPVRH